MQHECSDAPVPDNGAQDDIWNVLYHDLGADDDATKVVTWAQGVVAEIGQFSEWQRRQVARAFGYNLARVEDLLPPSE